MKKETALETQSKHGINIQIVWANKVIDESASVSTIWHEKILEEFIKSRMFLHKAVKLYGY